jgi:hypothetical protein
MLVKVSHDGAVNDMGVLQMMDVSKRAGNKHCLKILQERFLNSVANDLLPFMVGQSHESFTLLSVNDVGLFLHCFQANEVMCTGCRQEAL